MSGRKIVITGGAGFVGSLLGRELSAEGNDVTLIDNLSFGYIENIRPDGQAFANFVEDDIRTMDLVASFKDTDCVFHLAAISALPVCQGDPGLAFDVNVGGTAKVLEAARRAGVRRVVFASTSAVYENNKNFPCNEDDEVSPTLVYAQTKQASERLCKSFTELYGLEVAITRYYNVYGPNQDIRRKSPPFVAYVIRELLAGRSPVLHSDGKQKRDYVHSKDVNRINRVCMDHKAAPGQIFNVASGNAWSVAEMFAMIARAVGSNLQPTYKAAGAFWDAYPELYSGKYPLDRARVEAEVNKFTLGSTEKAKKLLGWSASLSIDDGIAQTAAEAKGILARAGQ